MTWKEMGVHKPKPMTLTDHAVDFIWLLLQGALFIGLLAAWISFCAVALPIL